MRSIKNMPHVDHLNHKQKAKALNRIFLIDALHVVNCLFSVVGHFDQPESVSYDSMRTRSRMIKEEEIICVSCPKFPPKWLVSCFPSFLFVMALTKKRRECIVNYKFYDRCNTRKSPLTMRNASVLFSWFRTQHVSYTQRWLSDYFAQMSDRVLVRIFVYEE